ncbi:MAG: AI-2E family transporter [Candidatus Paceibacterota bacterium]|jgi:predicted PurR-regulated permease PerM|nr:AI-2E family transporter [Candidatus Paceibacterota bacterium]MDD4830641.1 AI-2E family transporter [Candidatus Paceibacterota bacterium]MDD4875169.1 AI-2E family transporter [Candidatus Paceibacterota bacterium]
MANGNSLDISWGSLLKIGLALIFFYVIFLTQDILTLFIFSLIISVLFNPVIDFLQKRKIPRPAGTALVYLIFFLLVGGFVYFTADILSKELTNFSQLLPVYFEKAAPFLKDFNINQFQSFEVFNKYLQGILLAASSNIFSAASTFFGGIFTMFAIFTIAIFLSLEEKPVQKFLFLASPKKYEEYVCSRFSRIEAKVAGWFGSRVLSCVFVGILTYLLLESFAIKYSFTLSLIAAVTNIIPIAGPMVAGLFIGFFALLDPGLNAAILILIAFILIQQVEGNILTPMLTKKMVGIPPVVVIISLLVGARLWGIMGAILVIPMAGILYEFLKDFLQKKKEETIG